VRSAPPFLEIDSSAWFSVIGAFAGKEVAWGATERIRNIETNWLFAPGL